MIEGYDTEGRNILINPAEVIEVYAQITPGDSYAWGDWCNIKTTSGALHRFTNLNAHKVYHAIESYQLYRERAEAGI
jgi:uncharacterized protein affecting Mg2+/Co2+ transport